MKKWIFGIGCFLVAVGAWADGDALYRQGTALYRTDRAAAFELFEQAGTEGHVVAMVTVATSFEKGYGTAIDYANALVWYEKAARQNSVTALEGLARIYATCPDPAFHDGEKAVRFASVVVKKNPGSFAAMDILGAACARALDFNSARIATRKWGLLADTPHKKALIQRRMQRYAYGEPYPAIATEEWIARAAEAKSVWALDQLIWRSRMSVDPSYDRSLPMALCEKAIEQGDPTYQVKLGNLYLDAGDVEAAHVCFEKANDWWGKQNSDVRTRYSGPEIRYASKLKKTANEVMSSSRALGKPSSSKGGVYVTGNDGRTHKSSAGGAYSQASTQGSKSYTCPRCEVNPSGHCQQCYSGAKQVSLLSAPGPVNMSGAEFLLRVAALKGNREARGIFEGWERRSQHSMELYRSKNGLSGEEWSEALGMEAITHGEGNGVQGNLAVMDGFCAKAYQAKPSAWTAYLIGSLMVRETYWKRTQSATRISLRGIDWIERARAQGYQPAMRRLILLYACYSNEKIWNSDVALEYATEWVKMRPKNDHDAQMLLACAYARAGRYSSACQSMKRAIELLNPEKVDVAKKYDSMWSSFQRESPWREEPPRPSVMEQTVKPAADSSSEVNDMFESFKSKGMPKIKRESPSFMQE